MKILTHIGHWLVVIGALNWGLVGIGNFFDANWNIVNILLGSWPALESIVYILVGISAISMCCGGCKSSCSCDKHAGGSMPAQGM